MDIQLRIFKFITLSSWVLLLLVSTLSGVVATGHVTLGITAGGLLVNINFYFMYRSLKKSLTPPNLSTTKSIIAKHYLRFLFSIMVIYVLVLEFNKWCGNNI